MRLAPPGINRSYSASWSGGGGSAPALCRAAPGLGGRRATKNGTPTAGTGGPTPEQPVEGTDGQSASVQGDCRGVRRGLRRCRGASGADVTDGRPGWDRTALADGRTPRVGPGG